MKKCAQCGKETTITPCPYCGGEATEHYIDIKDKIYVYEGSGAVIVKGTSEVSVKKEGKINQYKFEPGTCSGEIVSASIEPGSPTIWRDFISANIVNIENIADDTQRRGEKIAEHSFTLKIPYVFEYTYKTSRKKSID